MPGKRWATPAQKEFLYSRLPEYKICQLNRCYCHFWPPLYEDWEKGFPQHEETLPGQDLNNLSKEDGLKLQTAIRERQGQLRSWYRWKCNSRARGAEKSESKLEKELEKEFLNVPSRSAQKSEVYSDLYYDEKIKPIALQRIQEAKATSCGEKLKIINEVTRELLENESPEVLEQIAAVQKERKAKRDMANDPACRTAEDYSRAISDIPAILNRFLKALSAKTGWKYSVLMGGPNPNENNEVTVASYHVGETSLGHTFAQAHRDFEEAYMGPYRDFLEHLFSSSSPDSDNEAGETGDDEGEGEEKVDMTGTIISNETATVPNPPTTGASLAALATPALLAPLVHHSTPLGAAVQTAAPPAAPAPLMHHSLAAPASLAPLMHHSTPLASAVQTDAPLATDAPVVHQSPDLPLFTATPSYNNVSSLPMPITGTGGFEFGNWDMGALDFGFEYADWPTLPGLPGDFSGSTASNFSLLDELNGGLSGGLDPHPNPGFTPDLSVFAPSTHVTDHPLRLDAPPPTVPVPPPTVPAPPPTVPAFPPTVPVPPPTVAALPPTVPAPPPAFPASDPVDDHPPSSTTPSPTITTPIPALAAQPAPTSRHSGRAILPSTRAKQMNDIGSNTKASATTDSSSANKENLPLGTIQAMPPWMIAAEAYLAAQEFGPEWAACLKAWIAFETHLGYADKKPMPQLNLRPEEWSHWIAKGRKGIRPYDQVPAIVSPLEFGTAIMKWWCAIQPAFRRSTDSPMPLPVYNDPKDSGCWETLQRGGPNGLLSVLTLLSWWGQSRKSGSRWEEDSEARWMLCIVDLRRVLERLVSGSKRGGSNASSAVASKKRKKA